MAKMTLRQMVDSNADANRSEVQERATMTISQSGTFLDTQREIKALIEKGMTGTEVVHTVWGKTIGVEQADEIAAIIDGIIETKYDAEKNIISQTSLTSLILTARGQIETLVAKTAVAAE